MNKKIYDAVGMALLSLPTTKNDRVNNKRRNISDMESTSAAQMISVTGINPENPLIFCGKHNKAIPIVRQLIKKSKQPFVLIGTKRDLGEESCLRMIDTEWEYDSVPPTLPEVNGLLMLKPGAQTNLDLKICLSEWETHLIILCIGNGLQVDQELLNMLNSIGHYVLLSESVNRGIKSTDGNKMTASDLLSAMEYILVSSVGTAAKDFLKVLPDFECEKITNTYDLSFHQDAPQDYQRGYHHRNGGGLRLSQSKVREPRCILTEEDLNELQASNAMIIHNAHSRSSCHTWIARITN